MIDLSGCPQVLLASGLLDIDRSMPITLVLFIVLAYVLNALIFNPLLKVLEDRERLTSGSVSDAKHMLEEYDRRLNEYEAALMQARRTCYQELEKQRAAAMGERMDLLNVVKSEAQTEISKTKAELAAQVESAQASLGRDAAAMAATISTSILGRSVGGVQ